MRSLDILNAILSESRRRDALSDKRDVRDLLTEKQCEPFDSTVQTQALLAGRGGGKSSVSAAKAVSVIVQRRRPWILLASLTKEVARRTLFMPLRQMAAGVGVKLPDPDQQGRVRLPDGGVLYLSGVDNRREVGKYRGTPWDFALVDECGEIPNDYLGELLYGVIEPRLMDKPWSQLWCSGTPGHALTGHWFDITGPEHKGGGTAPGWQIHRWDARDNPFVDAVKYFEDVIRRRGWDWQHPTFVREYLGQWITDALRVICGRGIPQESILAEAPDLSGWRKVLSLDFGLVDELAAVWQAYSPDSKRPVALHAWSKSGLSPSEASVLIAADVDSFKPDVIIGDSGGIGAAYIAEYARRQQLPIVPAKKDDKRGNLRLYGDDLHTRFDFVQAGTEELVKQCRTLIWDEKRQDVQPGQNDHQFHAAYYGWRYMFPALKPLVDAEKAKPKTQAQVLEERARRKHHAKSRRPGSFTWR